VFDFLPRIVLLLDSLSQKRIGKCRQCLAILASYANIQSMTKNMKAPSGARQYLSI